MHLMQKRNDANGLLLLLQITVRLATVNTDASDDDTSDWLYISFSSIEHTPGQKTGELFLEILGPTAFDTQAAIPHCEDSGPSHLLSTLYMVFKDPQFTRLGVSESLQGHRTSDCKFCGL